MVNLEDLKKGDWFAIMGRFGAVKFVAHFDGLLVFEEETEFSSTVFSLEVIRVYPETKFYGVAEALEQEVSND